LRWNKKLYPMRKLIFTTLFAAASALSFASESAADFQVNDQEFATEFAQLNALDAYVDANEGVTYSEMGENSLLENVSGTTDVNGVVNAMGEPPLGIPSFLWGFCFGILGILLVYFISDDRDETRKALIGCAVSVGAYFLIWLFVVIIFGGSFLFFG